MDSHSATGTGRRNQASLPPPGVGVGYPADPALASESLEAALCDRQRLAALRRLVPPGYQWPSVAFDRLTRLAADLLDAPVGLLTLVESDRQFFISSYGIEDPLRSARETSLDYSICQYTVVTRRPVVIGDATRDPRLEGSLAVVELGIAAYAGIPLVTPGGYPVGALCVVDFVARDWTDDKLAILAELAAICMDELRLAGLDRQLAVECQWRGVPDLDTWQLQ